MDACPEKDKLESRQPGWGRAECRRPAGCQSVSCTLESTTQGPRATGDCLRRGLPCGALVVFHINQRKSLCAPVSLFPQGLEGSDAKLQHNASDGKVENF